MSDMEFGSLEWCLMHNPETAYAYALRGLMMNELADIEENLGLCYFLYYGVDIGNFQFELEVLSRIPLLDRIENGLKLFIADTDDPPFFDGLKAELVAANAARNRLAHSVWTPHVFAYNHPSSLGESLPALRRMTKKGKYDFGKFDLAELEREVLEAQQAGYRLFGLVCAMAEARGVQI